MSTQSWCDELQRQWQGAIWIYPRASFVLALLQWRYWMSMSKWIKELGLPNSTLTLAVSITSLLSGMTIVMFGGTADKVGRVRINNLGFILAILGAVLRRPLPSHSALTAPILIAGRILQGLLHNMPTTLALLRLLGRTRQMTSRELVEYVRLGGGTSFAYFSSEVFLADNLGWRWILLSLRWVLL